MMALLCVAPHFAAAQIVPVNLGGTSDSDGWNNMNTYGFPNYPVYPGSSAWPQPMGSNMAASGDAELQRMSGGTTTGGPFPAEEALYFGSFRQVPNDLGGSLRIEDRTPVSGVKSVVLQIQIGEAEGYDFLSPSGVPVLKINGQTLGRASMTPVRVNRYQNGVFESPQTGLDEPVYVNTWGFQWDVSTLGAISSIQIDFSAVTHAQIYAMRLDQSSAALTSSVFAATSETRIIGLSGNLAFGQVIAGSSTTRTLTIANTGNAPLTVSGITYPSGLSGNWNSGSIAAGSSQNVTVSFAPTSAATLSGNITVASNATSGTNTIAVSGSSVAATRIIGLSGDMAFGNVTVNSTATRMMTISNTGNSVLTVNSISYPTGFTGNWSSGTIAAGSSRNVTVTFTPVAATSYGGTITVNSDRNSGTGTISTSGTGTAAATRIISLPASLDLGSAPVGGTQTAVLTIANTGNSTLNVTGVSYPSGISGDWNGGPIAAGGNRQVNVTFSPTWAGAFTGTLSVSSDATSGGNAVSLSGSGTPPAMRQNATGTAQYNGSVTSVTHGFNSTSNTVLQIEYTDNLTDPNSWVRHPGTVNSGNGQFDVTFSQSGDHRATWSRGMYFRLIYQK
jgi:uncharacterized membrane protein